MDRWRRIGQFVGWRLRTTDHRTLFLAAVLVVGGPVGAFSAGVGGRWLDVLICLGLTAAAIIIFVAPIWTHRLWIQGWKPGGRHSATPRLPWRRP